MPEKVFVDFGLLLPKQLEKDLTENERVCTTCKGLGILIRDNEYGLKSEPWIRGFPYKHQSLHPCPDCYNGVQRVCKYCGQPGSRIYTRPEKHCNCEGARAERDREAAQKEKELFEAATKVPFDDYSGLFLRDDRVITKEDLEDELCSLIYSGEEPPAYIWATKKEKVFTDIDLIDVVESNCEDGYEDMSSYFDYEDEDFIEAQELLSSWLMRHNDVLDVYYEDYRTAVMLEKVIKEIRDQINS